MNQPDITYCEVTPRYRRELVLHEHYLAVNGEGGGMKFEMKLMLADLRPEPDKLWYYDPAVRVRQFCLFVVPFGVVFGFMLQAQKWFPEIVYKLVLGLSVACLIAGCVCYWKLGKKIEYARFLNKSSGVVAMDLARSGPQRDEFDNFVSAVSKRIATAQDK